ncbi:hypothetical protein TNCT_485661 [Trichonephila clavata]|uniref:Uncharacterized protein n=1 Tax=Trichonephila clavata TaxID=2740835 RepID=A0A8X6J3J2_TRICU|nr:hypothetical protein TNCT_485661 [Trichonephila clavata]
MEENCPKLETYVKRGKINLSTSYLSQKVSNISLVAIWRLFSITKSDGYIMISQFLLQSSKVRITANFPELSNIITDNDCLDEKKKKKKEAKDDATQFLIRFPSESVPIPIERQQEQKLPASSPYLAHEADTIEHKRSASSGPS